MTELKLNVIQENHENCKLDKTCQTERFAELKKTLFSNATLLNNDENYIKVSFPYTKEILGRIFDFIHFENGCCNDFIINMHIDMKDQLIELEII